MDLQSVKGEELFEAGRAMGGRNPSSFLCNNSMDSKKMCRFSRFSAAAFGAHHTAKMIGLLVLIQSGSDWCCFEEAVSFKMAECISVEFSHKELICLLLDRQMKTALDESLPVASMVTQDGLPLCEIFLGITKLAGTTK